MVITFDFSSAFDTIDYPIIVHRLHTDFGFTDTVLRWFSSYLTDHTHYVSLSNHCSAFAPVHSGVPQGSVLGPILFTMYIKTWSAIIDSHSIIHHSFADDLQLQMSALPGKISELLHSMQSCISDVKAWATASMLKLNDNKTDHTIIPYHWSLSIKNCIEGRSVIGEKYLLPRIKQLALKAGSINTKLTVIQSMPRIAQLLEERILSEAKHVMTARTFCQQHLLTHFVSVDRCKQQAVITSLTQWCGKTQQHNQNRAKTLTSCPLNSTPTYSTCNSPVCVCAPCNSMPKTECKIKDRQQQ